MPGPEYTPAAPAQFSGPQTGLAPWLRQGTSPLQMQGFQANALRNPQMTGGDTPWYQAQMGGRQQDFALQEQQRQAELLRQQQVAADAAAATAQQTTLPSGLLQEDLDQGSWGQTRGGTYYRIDQGGGD